MPAAASIGALGIDDMRLRDNTFRMQLGKIPNFAPALATGVVAATLTLGGPITEPARAQSAPRAAAVTFAIPAQPLPAAVDAFIRATGWQVGYTSAAAASATSPGVSGAMAPADALRRLLAGSGLTVRMTGPNTATLVPSAARAAPAIETANAQSIMLDPINIEGEKVARDYHRTYTSVGVVTGNQIYEYDIPDLKRSFELLANVRSAPANRGNNGFVIRGLNSEGVTQPTNSAPIISVVVDGAIQNGEATRRGVRSVWDVEQIEVLRGPQSTLQGRNSLGGAVVIKTKDPSFKPEAVLDTEYGTDQYRTAAMAFGGAVVPDEVAVRFAGQIMRETKPISYIDPAVSSLARDEMETLRGKVLITPKSMPGFSALFTLSHTRDKPAVNAVTGPDFFARQFLAATSSVEFRETAVTNYVADLSYEVMPGWTVKSITAFADTNTLISTPTGSSFVRDETRTGGDFSQDLRLVLDAPGSPLTGVLGLFAGRFTNGTDSLITTTAFGPSILIQDLDSTRTTTSVAAYADLRYRFLERWSVILGGRVLKDTVDLVSNGTAFDFGTFTNVPFSESHSVSDTVFLPKAGLAFDLTVDQTIAATVNKGYRAGFGEVVVGTSTVHRVAPEFLWSYELAYRSRWFQDRLQINGNVFYYDYRNQQIAVDNPLIPGTSFTQNAGKSHAYGAEIETRARIAEGFSVFGALGLLKTEFDEAVTTTGNFNGNQFPESPAVTASLGGLYKHTSGLFAGADLSYTSNFFSSGDPTNDPLRRVGNYTILNARLGWEHKHATITLFARNLLDQRYLTSIAAGLNEATIGDSRMIGIRATGRL